MEPKSAQERERARAGTPNPLRKEKGHDFSRAERFPLKVPGFSPRGIAIRSADFHRRRLNFVTAENFVFFTAAALGAAQAADQQDRNACRNHDSYDVSARV